MPEKSIVVVGLGLAGRDHVRALEQTPGVAVVAAVDTEPSRTLTFRGRQVPMYHAVLDAKSNHDPDVVVIASPTPTHAGVFDEVVEHFPAATVLVEKPAASELNDALKLIGSKQPVSVAFHMAFSPEVSWAIGIAREKATELGPPVAIESVSADPYQADLASASARLCSSWIDTGINALSVIARFVTPIERTFLHGIGEPFRSIFEGGFSCETQGQHLSARILTSWYATDRSRTTRIRYASGTILEMDHNAVYGTLVQDNKTICYFGTDGSVSRRESHYRALYESWLTNQDPVFSTDTSRHLHELILSPP